LVGIVVEGIRSVVWGLFRESEREGAVVDPGAACVGKEAAKFQSKKASVYVCRERESDTNKRTLKEKRGREERASEEKRGRH
jgi:hypothetical protein